VTEHKITTYGPEHFGGVKTLWQEAFPDDPSWNAAEIAIPAKLAQQPDLFFVALDEGRVVGSIMAGYDGHRGWLYAVAVSNSHRRRSIGSALVHRAEDRLRSLGCGKINLQVRSTNIAVAEFYRRLGYLTEERISMGKRIIDPL
jgi:ribosomal protein S18 acetylase RimI-like enzyme